MTNLRAMPDDGRYFIGRTISPSIAAYDAVDDRAIFRPRLIGTTSRAGLIRLARRAIILEMPSGLVVAAALLA